MSRIIVADICSICVNNQSAGHCFAVAQNYLDIFKTSEEVRVAGGPMYSERFAPNVMDLPYDHRVGESKLAEKWHELMNCRALFKQVRSEDILVMQSIAIVTAFIGMLLFLHKRCRLFFIQYNTESINSPFKRLLWRMVSPKVHGVIATFPSVAQAYGKPFIIVPDYIYAAKRSVSFPTYEERKNDICMVGNIYRDKGTVEALQWLIGKGLKIVVAGKIGETELEPEVRAMANRDKNIELHIGYVSDEQYHAILSNSKYCMLNYRGRYNEHSSGVVYDALFHGTPVLSTATASTQMIKDYELGISFDNVNNLDLEKLSDVSLYDSFQSKISCYLQQQNQIIEQLSTFLHSL